MAQCRRTLLAPVALLFVWLAAWLAWPASVHAKPAAEKHAATSDDPYDAARDAESRLDYKAVVTNATRALDLANTHDRLVTLYGLLGMAYGVLGRSDDAVDAFQRLLAIDPDHRLPRGLSPKITKPFKEAGGYWIDRPGGLAVLPTLPREIAAGKAVAISVKVEDPLQMTANVRLSFRHEGEPEFAKVEMPMASPITFNIPAEQLPTRHADYAVELFFTALGATGSELRSAGDAAHPLSITVRASREADALPPAVKVGLVDTPPPPEKKTPLIKKWWLWTAVGVVVVGAAVGGGLGYYYSRDTAHVDVGVSTRVGP